LVVSHQAHVVHGLDDVGLATAHGIGAAAVRGPEAAGKPYAMATLHVYRTEGERLAEHWGVRDELGAMIQLGLVPMPAAPPELQALLVS
jgi:hypothetical protein